MITKKITDAAGAEIEVTVTEDEIRAALDTNEGLQKFIRQTPFVDKLIQGAVSSNMKKFEGFVSKDDFEKAIQDKDNEFADIRMTYEIEKSFQGVKHSNLLIKELDRSKLSLNNGKLIGIEGEIDRLKESYPDFFNAQAADTSKTKTTTPPAIGGNGVQTDYEKVSARIAEIEKQPLNVERRAELMLLHSQLKNLEK